MEAGRWQVADVTGVRVEAPGIHTLTLQVPQWPGHVAGQHAEIRLTAEDGYQAARNYSLASGPEDSDLQITVERLADGEVSPYLVDVVQDGDQIELRGPIGRHFVWEARMGGPLLLVAGGTGLVPFRSMLRHRAASGSDVGVRVLHSVRTPAEVLYRMELEELADMGVELVYVFTRATPPDWTGYTRRIDMAILEEIAWPPQEGPLIYVCGPTGFVETAAGSLMDIGHEAEQIRTERYGGT